MFGPWITDVERNMVSDALTEEGMYEKRSYYIEKFDPEVIRLGGVAWASLIVGEKEKHLLSGVFLFVCSRLG